MSTGPTHRPGRRLPRAAERLRLPVYQDGQRRMRERYGFDVNAPDALDRARSLRADTPSDAGAAIVLAAVLASRGEPVLAEAEARAAVELDPRSARAHTSLASMLIARDDRVGALDHARQAATLDSRDAAVLYNLGLTEDAFGDRARGAEAFRSASCVLEGRDPAAPRPRKRRWWQRG